MTHLLWNKLRVRGRAPVLPAGLRIYAVGDVHGCRDLLDELLGKIRTDIVLRPVPRSVYLFLGDYIDRGPASSNAISRLIDLSADAECVFLRGNHELIAMRCLGEPQLFPQWMRIGGFETLASYGVPLYGAAGMQVSRVQAAFHDAIPQSHLGFFRDLQNTFVCGDFLFVHAGIRPRINLSRQSQDDLLWIRDEFLTSSDDFGRIVVHGHTPVAEVDVRQNRINIDTGAFATACLSCVVIENGSLSVIDTGVHD